MPETLSIKKYIKQNDKKQTINKFAVRFFVRMAIYIKVLIVMEYMALVQNT